MSALLPQAIVERRDVGKYSGPVHIVNRPPERFGRCHGGRRHNDIFRFIERLRLRLEDLRHRRLLETAVVNVLHDADHRHPIIVLSSRVESFDPAADGILVPPIPARHRLVDQHNRWGITVVGVLEESAAQQRHTERLKIIAANAGPREGIPLLTRFVRMSVDRAQTELAGLVPEYRPGGAGRPYARQLPDALHRLFVERRAALPRQRIIEAQMSGDHSPIAEA